MATTPARVCESPRQTAANSAAAHRMRTSLYQYPSMRHSPSCSPLRGFSIARTLATRRSQAPLIARIIGSPSLPWSSSMFITLPIASTEQAQLTTQAELAILASHCLVSADNAIRRHYTHAPVESQSIISLSQWAQCHAMNSASSFHFPHSPQRLIVSPPSPAPCPSPARTTHIDTLHMRDLRSMLHTPGISSCHLRRHTSIGHAQLENS